MSASVVARRVVATPVRAAAEAWDLIVGLIALPGTAARAELAAVAGVGMSLLAAEAMRDEPIVVWGVGPRLRIYAIYDEDAILRENVSEEPLTWCPTDGEWQISLPCPHEDLTWVQATLARSSSRVTARELGAAVPDERSDGVAQTTEPKGSVDLEAFLRP